MQEKIIKLGAKTFFVQILMIFFSQTFEKKRIVGKILFFDIFSSDFFFNFLESSETYADPSLNEIREIFNFSSTFFVEKSLIFSPIN